MFQVHHLAAVYTAATIERGPSLQAARAELAGALDRARGAYGYTFDTSLGDAVDVLVTGLRSDGQSIDDAIDVTGAFVRAVRPAGMLSTDGAWEGTWRAYFALYDNVIQRTIRAFVIGSVEDEARAAEIVASQRTLAATGWPATPLTERFATTRQVYGREQVSADDDRGDAEERVTLKRAGSHLP